MKKWYLMHGEKKKRFEDGAETDSTSDVSGFTIIQADSRDAAIAILRDHPHFKNSNSPAMELLEFLPMPGM